MYIHAFFFFKIKCVNIIIITAWTWIMILKFVPKPHTAAHFVAFEDLQTIIDFN